MAVYGRFRERWNPLKIKSKTSKNKTYDQSGSSSKVYLWLDPGNIASGGLDGSYAYTTTQEADEIIFDIEGDNPSVLANPATQFDAETLEFSKGSGSFVHTALAGASQMTMASLAGNSRGYDTFISFWFKVSQSSYNTSHGHTLGGLYRSVPASFAVSPNAAETLTDLDPAFLFNLSSSNAIELRIQQTGSNNRLFFSTENDIFEDGNWVHVSIVIKDEATDLDRVVMFVNGHAAEMATMQNTSYVLSDFQDPTQLDVLLGNVTHRGENYGYRDSNSTTAGEGFFGNLADFVIFSQPTTTDAERENMARFVYEAQREGAYHLHSGIHSSTPRLEQLDLDRDSLYPPNFTLENYTMGAYQEPVARVSSRSESKYTEGALTDLSKSHSGNVEVWSEKASQRFVQTNYDEVSPQVWEETTNVMPHLRLDPSDTLLTNGNWYSDTRSEFFSEDLHPTTGFVISSDTAGLDVPRVDDELYREHYSTDTAQKYVETEVPEEYKDCFVIDIPLPNGTELQLGTDRQSVHGITPEQSRFTTIGNVRSTINGRVGNMAYYNFKQGMWEDLELMGGSQDYDYSLGAVTPYDTNFVDYNDVGFSPMTGIVVPASERLAQKIVPMYGKPTSDFGFPIANKFQPTDEQLIDLSKYIDESVILEGWEIKTKVIPKVGWQDQESDFYPGANVVESPYHYGGHGEAAVFFHPKKHVTGFDQKVLLDGSDEYHVGNTIPVTTVNGSGEETQPSLSTKGLVTSGITAFLLKKPKITDTDALAEDFFLGDEKKRIRKITDLDATSDNTGSWETLSAVVSEKTFDTTYKNHGDGGALPLLLNNALYNQASATSLVGWLQQVYHNDEHSATVKTRENWTRAGDDLRYRNLEGTPIVDLMSKENTTFVSDLLYDNTSEYDLHVVGNTKVMGQAPEGVPMTNFFIKPEDPASTELGVRATSGDVSKKYVVTTNMETTIGFGDGTLADHAVTPRYGAGTRRGTAKMPMANFPTKRVGTDPVNEFHIDVPLFDSLEDSSQVVLNPTDQLVLGIQNSVSTAFASQQLTGDSHPYSTVTNQGMRDFIRWGRTSLTLPVQDNTTSSPYLRLYIKKTRRDTDFNIIADSSNYNGNVNRDLGDHAIGDQYLTSNMTIYSGSMADDIVGPTVFTQPMSRISVPSSLTPSGIAFTPEREEWYSLTKLTGDKVNWFNDDQDCTSRPPWHELGEYMLSGAVNGGYSGNTPCFDWLLRNYTITQIQDALWVCPFTGGAGPGRDVHGNDWRNVTLASLGLPRPPLILDWTAVHRKAFDYGGSVPGKTHDNPTLDFGQYELLLQGFLTRNSDAYYAGSQTAIIYRNWSMNGNPFNSRHSGGWFIEECNPNLANAPAPTVTNIGGSETGSNGTTLIATPERRRSYIDCKAISAWYSKFKLPFFQNNVPGGSVGAITVEFRCVKIDTDYPPKYSDGTTVTIGDAFLFNPSHEIIKIGDGSVPNDVDQRFVDNQVIFIVVGGGVPASFAWADRVDYNQSAGGMQGFKSYHVGDDTSVSYGAWDPNSPATPEKFLSWVQLWDKIKSILTAQRLYNTALAYEVTPSAGDELFGIEFKNDPVLQRALRTNLETINDTLGFELLGQDLTGQDVNVYLSKEVHFVQGPGLEGISENWDGAPDLAYDNFGAAGLIWDDLGGKLYDSAYNEVADQGATKVGNIADNMFAALGDALVFASGAHTPGSAISNPTTQEFGKIRLDWANLPSTQPLYSFEKETFNEETGRRIDRKVVFRNSERDNTVRDIIEDPTKIGQASSFGSLKRFTTLIDKENPYWDSIMPLVDVSSSVDLSNFSPPVYGSTPYNGMGWLLETLTSKDGRQFERSHVTVKLDGQNPAQYSLDNTGAYEYSLVDEEGTTLSFPQVGTIGSVTYDKYTVTNYLHRDFRGINDLTRYTLRNLVFGFGNGASGRIKIRPSTSIWEAYDVSTRSISTVWPNEVRIDPIRGFRFGLLGYDEKPKYTFNQRHFGYLADMFEQAVDSKRGNFASDEAVFGSPVTINPINSANPEVPKLMENTSRYNKTTDATITVPYIESNYEATPNPPNLNAESLRVDVAGSIRTRAALAPGNVAANIRRRG